MSLPTFTPNTPTFQDEGTSISPSWVTENATLSQSGSTVRLTADATGVRAIARHPVTMPIANKDWCIYWKVKARKTAGDVQILQLYGSGTARCHVYLNFNVQTNSQQLGSVGIRHTSAANQTSSKHALTGIDFENESLDLVMHFDSKLNQLVLGLRQASGAWKKVAACNGSFFGGDVAFQVFTSTTAGAWVEFDFIELVSPNIIWIGDSICNGYPSAPDTSIQTYCPAYLEERNNFPVNKGVNGNTSALVAGRIVADCTSNNPRVVFLFACNNDKGAGITQAQRKANVQASVDACAGAKVILLNAVYWGAESIHNNPPTLVYTKDYFEESWNDHLSDIAVDLRIDITQPVKDANGFQATAYLHTDLGHNNPAGASAIGAYISTQ